MPLHDRDSVRDALETDIYGTHAADASAPKFKLGAGELRADVAHAMVRDELFLDGNSRQNLSTFCQTWLDPQVHELMDLSIDKNMIDKDEYPATAEIEKRCVHILADLWHSPTAANTIGCSTTGSSEACMLGGLALKWKWRLRMEAEGKPTGKPNLVTGPVQVCWHKFARYFDVELREIPLEKGRLGHDARADAEARRREHDRRDADPRRDLHLPVRAGGASSSAALDKLQAETGLDMPIHVDAASGGFIAPFIEPDLVWDFRLPRVKSINASGHKFGLAPLGVGWVVWRDRSDLPEELIFNVNYLGGNMPTFALNFSRPAGQIIAQYYLFLRLGRDGYTRILRNGYESAQHLGRELCKLGPFDMAFDGNSKNGIPAVSWVIKDGADPGYSLFDLSDRLRMRGWQVAAYTMPREHPGRRRDARARPARLQPRHGRHAAGGREARDRVPAEAQARVAGDRRRGNRLHPQRCGGQTGRCRAETREAGAPGWREAARLI